MLPDTAKRFQKMEELRAQRKDEYLKVRAALRLAVNDPNMMLIFRHMAKVCGFFKTSLVTNPQTGEINPLTSTYNEGRRAVYLAFRQMMTDEQRRQVESKGEEDADIENA